MTWVVSVPLFATVFVCRVPCSVPYFAPPLPPSIAAWGRPVVSTGLLCCGCPSLVRPRPAWGIVVCPGEQALFLWIVSAINTSLGKGDESLPFIGVLDIFGGCMPRWEGVIVVGKQAARFS